MCMRCFRREAGWACLCVHTCVLGVYAEVSLLVLLLSVRTWKTYSLGKGPKFAQQRKKQATELTSEMLARCVCGGGARESRVWGSQHGEGGGRDLVHALAGWQQGSACIRRILSRRG